MSLAIPDTGASHVARPRQPGVPSALVALLTVAGVKLALRAFGIGPTLRWVLRRTSCSGVVRPDADLVVAATMRAVALAAALYPGRALCLEQSVALCWLLRRAGLDARVRFGVQAYPFLAHAWVDFDDKPVNENPEHLRCFVPMPDLAS